MTVNLSITVKGRAKGDAARQLEAWVRNEEMRHARTVLDPWRRFEL